MAQRAELYMWIKAVVVWIIVKDSALIFHTLLTLIV
jgi:hypothetical protein